MTRPALLIALAVLTLAALALVIGIEPDGKTDGVVAGPLVPGLQDQLNEVNQLHLAKGGNETVATLKRLDHGWVVTNRFDYPADVSKIRETLLGLAAAELIEQKTANPEYYERLGLQAIEDKDAKGVQLILEGLDQPVQFIIGNQATAGGTFVRRTGDEQSWLVSGNLQPPQDTAQWLDRSIIDIAPEQLHAIVIRHPYRSTLRVEKQTPQADFTVAAIPAGRELASVDAAQDLANALIGLQLDDVLPVAQKNPATAEGVVQARYHIFDGRVITARAFQADDRNYVHFGVDFNAALAQRFAGPAQGKAVAGDAGQEKSAEAAAVTTAIVDETELEERRQQAEALNAKLAPWVYEIPDYHYELITQRMDDLLKPEEVTEEAAKPAEEKATPTPAESGS